MTLSLNQRGVTLAAIGLRRRRGPRDAAIAGRAFAWSMPGIIASTALGLLLVDLALHLDPGMLAVRGTAVPVPPLTVSGVVKMVAMSLAAGIGEELILSVLLVIVMAGASQPRWRWLALAAALRVAFHLYLGIWGFGAVLFAAANAAIFVRTRPHPPADRCPHRLRHPRIPSRPRAPDGRAVRHRLARRPAGPDVDPCRLARRPRAQHPAQTRKHPGAAGGGRPMTAPRQATARALGALALTLPFVCAVTISTCGGDPAAPSAPPTPRPSPNPCPRPVTSPYFRLVRDGQSREQTTRCVAPVDV